MKAGKIHEIYFCKKKQMVQTEFFSTFCTGCVCLVRTARSFLELRVLSAVDNA